MSNGSRIWESIEKILFALFTKIWKMFGKEMSDEVFKCLMQFIRFGIVGVSNTVVSYMLYVFFLLIFQYLQIFSFVDYVIAHIAAYLLSVLWSFYWNNRMVFKVENGEKRSWWQALIKTYISYLFSGIVIHSLLLVLWVQILGISEFIAPIISLVICIPLNFIMNKFWAFKEK